MKDRHNSLSTEIKDQVNKLDLLKFLNAMRKTGHVQHFTHGVLQLLSQLQSNESRGEEHAVYVST